MDIPLLPLRDGNKILMVSLLPKKTVIPQTDIHGYQQLAFGTGTT